MEGAAKGRGDVPIPIPAQLHHPRLKRSGAQRHREPRRRSAGVEDHVGVAGSPEIRRGREAGAEALRNGPAAGVKVHHRNIRPRQARREVSHQKAHQPRAHHHDPVPRPGAGIPEGVEGGLHIGGQHGPARRQGVGQGRQHGNGRGEARLVGMQAEDAAAHQLRRFRRRLHQTHGAIAIFDRKGERPLLQGRAHALVLGGGNPPGEDQPLRAPAEARPEHPHQRLPGSRLGLGRAQVHDASFSVPKGK